MARLNGLGFHTLDIGAGLPFVFQHGMGGDANQTRDTFTPPLPFRLLTLECRGHGTTGMVGDEAQLNFDQLSDDVANWLNTLNLERVLIGGISMGAGVALNFALRYPAQVLGLVLVRPAWLAEPLPANLQVYPRIAALIRQYGLDEGRRLFQQTNDYLSIQAVYPQTAASLLKQFSRPNAQQAIAVLERMPNDAPNHNRAAWSSINVPTLVLANERDPVHPFAYAETLAQAIPKAKLVTITSKEDDGAQHNRDIQAALLAFLNENKL